MTTALRENLFVDAEARNEARGLLADATATLTDLPEPLRNLLTQILQQIAEGHTVVVGALPDELTTSVAADQLGISRPTLMKHIRAGRIPAHKVGTHTRVKTEDVQRFRRTKLAEQRASLEALLELEAKLDLD